MYFRLARLLLLVFLLFGRLNALNEKLTSKRCVYEEHKKVIRMKVRMERMKREMSQRKTLENLTLEIENKIAEMLQTQDKVKNTLCNLTVEVENKIAEISQAHGNMKTNLDNLTLETENKISDMSQTHDQMKNTLGNFTLETENKTVEMSQTHDNMRIYFDKLTLETEKRIAEMSQTHENVKITIGNLTLEAENKMAELSQTKENVKITIGNLTLEAENKMAELSQTHENVKNTIGNLTLEAENQIAELKLLDEKVSLPMIAFNAYGLADFTLDTNQIVVFKNTYLNEGNCYDTNLGVFTAPVDGLYMFSMHACTNYQQKFYHYIIADDTVIARSVKYEGSGNDCSSVVTFTKLEKYQRVWVVCSYKSSLPGNYQLRDTIYAQPTFSGVLLHG